MTPRLEIPLASADVAHHAAPQRARAIRILLIEDNLADARLVMEMFSELGAARFELQHAQDYLVKGQVGADLLACTLRHAAPDPGFAAVFMRVPWCRAGAL